MKLSAVTRLRGQVVTPGDKSISHRAVLISALANGSSSIKGISRGADVLATIEIMRQLGASVREGKEIIIDGPAFGLRSTDQALNCGNSGTTMRLLMGILAGVPGSHWLDGDESLRRRPMNRVAIPLELMGVKFSHPIEALLAPFRMSCDGVPLGLSYEVPVPSAQVKSAVLFAGLTASSETTVTETTKTRANTEEMLVAAGVPLKVTEGETQRTIRLTPSRPQPHEWVVPQDPSQAAFFIVAGIIHPDAELMFEDIYAAPERTGYLNVLSRMGADFDRENSGNLTRIMVRSSQLHGTTIHSTEIPSVDEVPILVVAAAAASGTSVFIDMSELRLKESDRFANSVSLAKSLGATVDVDGDSFSVTGVGSSAYFRRPYASYPGDHRMTMATAIAGICGQGAEIDYPESTSSSFPNFFELLSSLSS